MPRLQRMCSVFIVGIWTCPRRIFTITQRTSFTDVMARAVMSEGDDSVKALTDLDIYRLLIRRLYLRQPLQQLLDHELWTVLLAFVSSGPMTS